MAFLPTYADPQDADGNNTYVVVVRATDGDGNTKDQTVTVTVTEIPVLPGDISDLSATALSETAIELDWTPAADADSHEYRIDGGSAQAASGPPMTVSGLTEETEYDFEVRGVNEDGNGDWSNVATETTEADTAPTITSSASVSVAENATLSHALTADEAVTWEIVPHRDSAYTEVSGSTLRWLNNGTMDYEYRQDDNITGYYITKVRATDANGNFTDQVIEIDVTDISDGTGITGRPTLTIESEVDNVAGTPLAVALAADEPVVWTIAPTVYQDEVEISSNTLRWLGNGTRTLGTTQRYIRVRGTSIATSKWAEARVFINVVEETEEPPVNEYPGQSNMALNAPIWNLVGELDEYPPVLSVVIDETAEVAKGATWNLLTADNPDMEDATLYQHLITDAEAAADSFDFGVSGIADPDITFMYAWISDEDGVGALSTQIGHGDTSIPVLSSATGTTWAEGTGNKLLVVVTSNEELADWGISGAGVELVEISPTTAHVRLIGNADIDYDTGTGGAHSYSYTVTGTDYFGNVGTLSRTDTITNDAEDDPPEPLVWVMEVGTPSNMNLSNGDLTATRTYVQSGSIRANNHKASGAWIAGATVDAVNSSEGWHWALSVGTSAVALNAEAFPGSTADSDVGYFTHGVIRKANGNAATGLATCDDGDGVVAAFAKSGSVWTVWFGKVPAAEMPGSLSGDIDANDVTWLNGTPGVSGGHTFTGADATVMWTGANSNVATIRSVLNPPSGFVSL